VLAEPVLLPPFTPDTHYLQHHKQTLLLSSAVGDRGDTEAGGQEEGDDGRKSMRARGGVRFGDGDDEGQEEGGSDEDVPLGTKSGKVGMQPLGRMPRQRLLDSDMAPVCSVFCAHLWCWCLHTRGFHGSKSTQQMPWLYPCLQTFSMVMLRCTLFVSKGLVLVVWAVKADYGTGACVTPFAVCALPCFCFICCCRLTACWTGCIRHQAW